MRTREDEDYERHAGYSPDDDEPVTGWCECCGEECIAIEVDNGIGAYEYWGFKGVDRRIDIESNCCNAKVLDYYPEPEEEDCDVELP